MEHTCIEGGDGPVEDPCLACGGAIDERIRLDEAMMVLREHCLSLVRARKTVVFFDEKNVMIRAEPADGGKWRYWFHERSTTDYHMVNVDFLCMKIDDAVAFPANKEE
jgi:hypothetical protein